MSSRPVTSLLTFLARLTWILIGPIALVFLTLAILKSAGGLLVAADIAFFIVLVSMLLGRWIEYRSGQGETAAGAPMVQGDLRRYLIGTGVVGCAVLVVANLIANHWLGI